MNHISIHAPREGSDSIDPVVKSDAVMISIHAPREGSDYGDPFDMMDSMDFNPRSPRGERHG